MNVIEALQWRYATKSFNKDKMISKKSLDIILQAFNLTATSYGLQPLKLLVIADKKLQQDLVKYSMNQEQVAQASHVLVICVETVIDKAFIENYFKLVKTTRHTADNILDPFKTFLIDEFASKSQKEIRDWAVKQAYLALGNLLTVCALEKIDACPMEGFEPDKYDTILNLKPKGLASVLVLPIGYRAENDFMAALKKVRKDLKDSIIEL